MSVYTRKYTNTYTIFCLDIFHRQSYSSLRRIDFRQFYSIHLSLSLTHTQELSIFFCISLSRSTFYRSSNVWESLFLLFFIIITLAWPYLVPSHVRYRIKIVLSLYVMVRGSTFSFHRQSWMQIHIAYFVLAFWSETDEKKKNKKYLHLILTSVFLSTFRILVYVTIIETHPFHFVFLFIILFFIFFLERKKKTHLCL